jgi:hypothetical protein
MKRTKKTVKRGNFLSRVQKTPKMKRLKAKIKKVNSAKKVLSIQYKRLLKSEGKRLSK